MCRRHCCIAQTNGPSISVNWNRRNCLQVASDIQGPDGNENRPTCRRKIQSKFFRHFTNFQNFSSNLFWARMEVDEEQQLVNWIDSTTKIYFISSRRYCKQELIRWHRWCTRMHDHVNMQQTQKHGAPNRYSDIVLLLPPNFWSHSNIHCIPLYFVFSCHFAILYYICIVYCIVIDRP